ncbi:hypothetical protein Mgra_00000412 [Meloidogyne graminicola]|uniref:Carboxylic ester hydrolase n=1 Tax=Meloidogyne graminicola TaxID=189291 RepID=A0A8T0A3S6_9BILA|nr:hypothetical protein Mgra_00000412 [Meloidogyne graminicola]
MNKTLINSSEFTKIIQTKFGKIQGFKYKLSNEKWADIFLGIPFAKPPIGELRFENPQPPETWEGILNCSEFGLSSISVDLKSFKTSKYSEDCLTLNIFCPSEISSSSPLPVFFYIHGGGFCTGSAVDYGFKHWVENFIPQEIILVTIQYRLGPLGFLSLGEFMPGNFGLWDMALALKFVYENIENFGGNCHKITVGGLSAGGAASASLALSPITKDMVYATIEMSGTVLAEWTASEQVVTSGREFAKRALMLGEENNDSKDLISLLESTNEPLDLTSIERIKQKLKLLSIETIIKITTEMGTTRYEPNLLVWTPRIDGIFFLMIFFI